MPGVIHKDISATSLFCLTLVLNSVGSIFKDGFTSCYRNKRMKFYQFVIEIYCHFVCYYCKNSIFR